MLVLFVFTSFFSPGITRRKEKLRLERLYAALLVTKLWHSTSLIFEMWQHCFVGKLQKSEACCCFFFRAVRSSCFKQLQCSVWTNPHLLVILFFIAELYYISEWSNAFAKYLSYWLLFLHVSFFFPSLHYLQLKANL